MNETGPAQLEAEDFYAACIEQGIDYFCGVPDSVVGPVSLFLNENQPSRHDIAANEGNAVGLAIGHYLATSRPALVYMQNSGLGNALDPLTSLADPAVLGVPVVLLIGWRGRPGTQDEPQHHKPGAKTLPLLDTFGIPHQVLSRDALSAQKQIATAVKSAQSTAAAYALVVEPGTFAPYHAQALYPERYSMSREQALHLVLAELNADDAIIATNGKLGRELYEYRQGHLRTEQRLYLVGGMGHASSIAMRIAAEQPSRRVVCLDGDGSVLMHLGALAIAGSRPLPNFLHIVFNNGAHDSTGGQPTIAFGVDLAAVALACGYRHAETVETTDTFTRVKQLLKSPGPNLLEIRVRLGARPDLTRPSEPPSVNRAAFQRFLDKHRRSL